MNYKPQKQQECIADFNCIHRNGVMEFYMLENESAEQYPS